MFLWSILASFHPCGNDQPNRVSNYRQYFDKFNIEGFDFSNGYKCSDVHKFEKLNKLSINIFALNFYQYQSKWKHNLILIEINKNNSDRVVDLLIYKNLYVLIKKIHVFLGNYIKSFICRRCLSSYTSENVLGILEPK